MRGPSSSHTAASVRIGILTRQILDDKPVKAVFEFDPMGSLATTYSSQGSDIGLAAGLLNWEISNPDLPHSLQKATEEGIDIEFRIVPFQADHPNTYRISLTGKSGKKVKVQAVSYGGGMVEIISIDDIPVNIRGDYYEVLVNVAEGKELTEQEVRLLTDQTDIIESVTVSSGYGKGIILYKMSKPAEHEWLKSLEQKESVTCIVCLEPVMPVLSSRNIKVPFNTASELAGIGKKKKISLYDAAMLYECHRSSFSEEKVFLMMKDIVVLLQESVRKGLEGTRYSDRILGYQSGKFEKARKKGNLIDAGLMNKIISSNMALMEVKSSMGLIVAAPTAGSCATLPGTLIPTADTLGLDQDDLTKAFLVAGMIGVFIANGSTFAAEECGCQAECGSASGMAAAGLVQFAGGTVEQGIAAASMALQNTMGMTCDPVANRVEVPCLGKNVMGAVNALASANMALAGIDPVIPLDEVIHAMDETGKMLPRELCCTGLGGLSLTPTSKRIEEKLRVARQINSVKKHPSDR